MVMFISNWFYRHTLNVQVFITFLTKREQSYRMFFSGRFFLGIFQTIHHNQFPCFAWRLEFGTWSSLMTL